jgi:hypothetical protein
MNKEESLIEDKAHSAEDPREIAAFNEQLLNTTVTYLNTVRKDLDRLHPGKEAEVKAFLKNYTTRALTLKKAIETQYVHYNTSEQLNRLYNELLDDVYNGSLAFDREQIELEAAVPVEPEIIDIPEATPTEEEKLETELEQENLARIAQENPPEGNSLQVVNYEKSMPPEFKQAIASADSFDDIYVALEDSSHIIGSKGIYSAQEMIGLIENYRDTGSEEALIQITRTGGLRDKVFDLYQLGKPQGTPAAQPVQKQPLPPKSGPRAKIMVDKSPAKSLGKTIGSFFKRFFS